MTLLSVTQDAMVRCGLSKPSYAVASTDPNVVEMISLVNQTGKHLMRRHAWQALQTEKTFTTTATETQSGAVPTDFDRFIDETFWNRSKKRRVFGPLTVNEWQARQASTVGGITDYFRMRGSALLFNPVPSAGDTMAYEYVSKWWVAGDKDAATADSDTFLVEENLLTLGATWRYLKLHGMDYAEEFREFEFETETAISHDGGKRSLRFGASRSDKPLPPIAPEGDWMVS
jgi:hypothetical protein